jgi:hypothetical protein
LPVAVLLAAQLAQHLIAQALERLIVPHAVDLADRDPGVRNPGTVADDACHAGAASSANVRDGERPAARGARADEVPLGGSVVDFETGVERCCEGGEDDDTGHGRSPLREPRYWADDPARDCRLDEPGVKCR